MLKHLIAICVLVGAAQATVIGICTKGFGYNATGALVCLGDSLGNVRAANEVDCQFPFQYNNVWYDTCTNVGSANSGAFWCSLTTVYNGMKVPCAQQCSLLARDIMAEAGDTGTHTSCLQPVAGMTSYFPADQATIGVIVGAHNKVRATVNPTATDLEALAWDIGLARLAQRRAETCQFFHESYTERTLVNQPLVTVGQNIFMTGQTYRNLSALWLDTVNAWANEVKDFTYGSEDNDFEAVGHYTQLVNSNTVRVGCGAASCKGTSYVYCDYALGQMGDQIAEPYQSGPSCSECGVAGSADNLCKCNLFCLNGGTLDLANCKCDCPAYTTGAQCETKTCTLTDQDYGCYWGIDASWCMYSNIPPICPFMCGLCTYTI